MLEGNKSSNNKNKNNDNNTRTAIITGSCKGIGKAIAMEFAKARYDVMINDFEEEGELKRTAYEISKAIGDSNNNNNDNPRVAYFIGDVSEEQISISLMEETIKVFGRINVLVNNAAIAQKKAAPKRAATTRTRTNETSTNSSSNSRYSKQVSPYFTLEEYEVADTSLKGMYLCIREAAKKMEVGIAMANNKQEGENDKATRGKQSDLYSIINVSSSYESIPKPDVDAYTLSMSGVDPFTSSRVSVKNLTKTVALQLAEKGIRVNAIAPGLIATDINKKLLGNEEKRKEKEKQIPFHRIGTPEEVAKIALFLASDDASYITGSLIYADGGLSLSHSNYFLESEIEED
jgi:glucose 1-dehydrogenase